MEHALHRHQTSLNRLAFSATAHCLSGCSIGEALGLLLGTALHWGNGATIALAAGLAFVFGYALTLSPLVRAGMTFGAALRLALISDTLSIAVMEVVDNSVMLLIPGAMEAGIEQPFFWGSMALSLLLAGAAAFPLNRWLIARGRGHAVVHEHHHLR
jgi:hypothetical protein